MITDNEKRKSMEEQIQLKIDIGEVKSNVFGIKEDMHDIKYSLGLNFEKIENVLLILAGISEKQIYNIEEHKQIHKRIDNIEECNIKMNEKVEIKANEFREKFDTLHKEHIECIAMNKHHEDSKTTTSTTTTTSNNSVFKRAIDKVIEYSLIVLVCLVLYILAVNAPEFFKFVDTKPAAVIEHIK